MKANTSSALVIIDYINEIADPKGKLAGKGYPTFMANHGTLNHLKPAIKTRRSNNVLVLFVRIGFLTGYIDQPEASPLFGGAKKFAALQLGTWATEFLPDIAPLQNE